MALPKTVRPLEGHDLTLWLRRQSVAKTKRQPEASVQLMAAAEEIHDLRSYFKHIRGYCTEMQKHKDLQRVYITELESELAKMNQVSS